MTESERFVDDVVIFFASCIGVFLLLVIGDYIHRRRKLREGDKAARSSKNGLFMVKTCQWLVRGAFGVTVMMILIIPICVVLVCLVFGPLVAALEGWPAMSGIQFLMGNLLGLANPLTHLAPTSVAGSIFAYILSLLGLLIVTAAMGLVAQMSLVSVIIEAMPETFAGLLRFVVLYTPASLTLLALATAVPMAIAEDWAFSDAFFYMAGAITQDTLTDVVPATAAGCFVEVVCTCFELSLGGAIIGVVGATPLAARLIAFVEGGAGEGRGAGATDDCHDSSACGADEEEEEEDVEAK
eukprot:CAMPEP_0115572242 /NCGR_PEP_ID=MMETSP0272-20121206/370_1 /TAXON_ID=71861 /ORGANISM="Scrippsiella trochoidea, Strain CCMP3099" /LENGTH=296 /DNA_ID=CAMNT_0003006845 /DNA_START=106 /DNA_END=993 /DNA_ORIENTATION=-